jgi:hypothetical protein
VTYDFAHSAPYAFGQVTDPQRVVLRIATTITLAIMLWCLRGNARALAARSYLMRTGRVDRQTMAAMLGVLAIILVGDVILLASANIAGPTEEQLRQVGRLVVLVGSTLFTLGLAGVALDCLRLRPVLEPYDRSCIASSERCLTRWWKRRSKLCPHLSARCWKKCQ